MDNYTAYIKGTKRVIIAAQDLTLDAAIYFLDETRNGIIKCDNEEYTKEELENVKSFGSKSRIGQDNPVDTGREIFEDPDRELFGTFGDRTESGTECDN